MICIGPASDQNHRPNRLLLDGHIMIMNESSESAHVSIEPLGVGRLSLNRMSRIASVDNRDISLTSAEFEVLDYLAAHPGKVVSRDELFRQVLGMEYDGLDRTIDLRVSRLRRKLGDSGESRQLIKSVRSEGYILTPDSRE